MILLDYMTFMLFLLGLAVGSFLNVVIDRFPKGEDIVWKPSHCDYCRKRLRWFELIPLFSFILQRGRCLRCRKRLSWQYPVVELVSAAGFLLLYLSPSPNVSMLLASYVIFASLLILFVIDIKHMILPDIFLWIVVGVLIVLGIPLSPHERLVHAGVAISCGAAFFLLWALTRGKGLGFGDVKLVTVLGLLLGFPRIVIALYVAFLTGAIWGVILMIRNRASMKSRIAFGPFLITGCGIALLWGEAVWQWWLRLLI